MRGYLRRNHRTACPGLHVALDTETAPTQHDTRPAWHVHRLRLGVAIRWRERSGRQSGREVFRFRGPCEFWGRLEAWLDPRRPCWLWAHNLFYDLTALRFWEQLESGDYRLEEPDVLLDRRRVRDPGAARKAGLLATDDPPSIVVCWHRSGAKLVCVDTMNWFPGPLADLGRAVGLEKGQMPARGDPDASWAVYCERDAKIVELAARGLMDWVRGEDLGNMRYSAASQAFAAYRHRFMPPAAQIFTPDEAKPLERRCYYPARQFLHFQGEISSPERRWFGVTKYDPPNEVGPVYVLDVSSCYPTVMEGHDYPGRYVNAVAMQSPRECMEWAKVYCLCAECEVYSRDEPYPVRAPAAQGGRVTWQVGRGLTFLCGPELVRALESGHVRHLGRVQYYTRCRLFDGFVRWALEGRRKAEAEGKPLWASLYKLVANSLHGKFGQRSPRWEIVQGVIAPMPWGHFHRGGSGELLPESYRSVAYTVQRQGHGEESEASMPLICAYATAYARERMRAIKLAAGERQVLYEDCDTAHVLPGGYARLCELGWVRGGEPGYLRLVGTYDTAEYRGVRHYRLGDDWVRAGLTLRAVPTDDGRWSQSVIDGPDAVISRGPLQGPLEITQTAADPLPYVPGVVGHGGWVGYFSRG